MANRTKIQDQAEAERWLSEGRSYSWIVEQYREKYHVETTVSMWAALRRRLGMGPRIVRDADLIPWHVLPEHRQAHPVSMLRAEARRRAGKPLSAFMTGLLEGWVRGLQSKNVVVHYDPEVGWQYLAPRAGIDTDLIRVPDRRTGKVWYHGRDSAGSPVAVEVPGR